MMEKILRTVYDQFMVDEIASALAHKRWKKATAKQRTEAAQTMNAAKTPEEMSEIGRKAAAARWVKAKSKKAKKAGK